ncbi:MAG: DUF1439 domain-containing protein [Rubrivivax sp.]
MSGAPHANHAMRLKRRAFCSLMLAPAAALCADLFGLDTITFGLAQMQDLVARRFPLRRRWLDALDFEVATPTLRLLPQDNRLATEIHVDVVEKASGQRAAGLLDLDFALRYASADGTVRLVQPRVLRAELDGGPAGAGRLDAQALQIAAPLLARLLDGFVVHRLEAGQLAFLRSAGVQPGAIRVTPEGVQIDIEAASTPASAPR